MTSRRIGDLRSGDAVQMSSPRTVAKIELSYPVKNGIKVRPNRSAADPEPVSAWVLSFRYTDDNNQSHTVADFFDPDDKVYLP